MNNNFKYDNGANEAKKRKKVRAVKPLRVECTNCEPTMILKDGEKRYPKFNSLKALMKHNHLKHSKVEKVVLEGVQSGL